MKVLRLFAYHLVLPRHKYLDNVIDEIILKFSVWELFFFSFDDIVFPKKLTKKLKTQIPFKHLAEYEFHCSCLALKPNYYYVTLFPQGNIFQVQITALTQELVNHEICSQSGFRFLEKRVLMHLWNMPAPPQLVKLQAQEISRMKASCIARGQWRWQNPMSWAYHRFSIASFLGDCPCGRF